MSAHAVTTSAEPIFPPGFESLEPFAAWSLRTESERIRRRQAVDMTEIRAFRDAIMGGLDKVFLHLGNQLPSELQGADARLFYLVLSLAEIMPAVEFYRQPAVVDGFDALRFLPVEDRVTRPKL